MTENITSYKFACVIARFLDEKIAKDISILNISNVSSFADYFVICSAQTNTQVKALTENLTDKVKSTFSRLPIQRFRIRFRLFEQGRRHYLSMSCPRVGTHRQRPPPRWRAGA